MNWIHRICLTTGLILFLTGCNKGQDSSPNTGGGAGLPKPNCEKNQNCTPSPADSRCLTAACGHLWLHDLTEEQLTAILLARQPPSIDMETQNRVALQSGQLAQSLVRTANISSELILSGPRERQAFVWLYQELYSDKGEVRSNVSIQQIKEHLAKLR